MSMGGKPKKPEKSAEEIAAEKEAERRKREAAEQAARRADQEQRRGLGTGAFLRQQIGGAQPAALTSVLGV